jgi:hypothetical protein
MLPEIAAYLSRSVRTIQRWEQFYDLPVNRDNAGVRATTAEIDEWMINPLTFRTDVDLQGNRGWNADVREDARELMMRSRELCKQAQSERAAAGHWYKRA